MDDADDGRSRRGASGKRTEEMLLVITRTGSVRLSRVQEDTPPGVTAQLPVNIPHEPAARLPEPLHQPSTVTLGTERHGNPQTPDRWGHRAARGALCPWPLRNGQEHASCEYDCPGHPKRARGVFPGSPRGCA